MIKSIRNKIISVLALIACVTFAILIGVNANLTVKADTETVDTNVFTMWNTASIRTDKDPAGIRFSAKLGVEKFEELAGTEEGASINVVFVANKTGADSSLEITKAYPVTADSFKNDPDGIINIMYTLTFANEWEDAKKAEAYAMDLTVSCKAYAAADTEFANALADAGTLTQDARSVASFNDLIDGTEGLIGYYTSAKMVDGVAPYVAGTVGTKIYVDGAVAGSSVYINTVKVNAEIADGYVTIAKADMANLLTTAPKNIIQVIDADGNVLAKELTEEIPVYNDVLFSALDGDLPVDETAGTVEVISNSAVAEGTAFSAATFENGKLSGLDISGTELTKVQIKLTTDYSVQILNLKAATKIIDEASDLTSVYGNTTSAVTTSGYFYVANDIKYDASVAIKPVYNDLGSGSIFNGVFDGGNHTIEYGIIKGGLFGNLSGAAIIKNAAFVVKSITTSTAKATYAMFAGYSNGGQVQNVYATYDVEFQVDFKSSASPRSVGLGFFMASNNWNDYPMSSVVVDLSNVEITSSDGTYSYGVPVASGNYSYGYGTQNTYVIWGENKLLYDTTKLKIIYAQNDYPEGALPDNNYSKKNEETGFTETWLSGLYRYDTLAEMATNKPTLNSFVFENNIVKWSDGRIISVRDVENVGEIIYDGEGDLQAVLPESLSGQTITKITDSVGGTMFDGNTWSIERNTSNEKVVIADSLVYGADDALICKVDIVSVAKVITKASDLTSLYGNSGVTTKGYFLVANDIEYDESVEIKPVYNNYASGSTFSGVFDGNGHTVEFGLNKGGLFGNISSATVKNVSLIVKKVKAETTTSGADTGMYAILAGYAAYPTITNVYAKYDVEFTADLTAVADPNGVRYRGLGLCAVDYDWQTRVWYTDVILDLSKVTLKTYETDVTLGYGVLGCPLNGGVLVKSSNCHVIWQETNLANYKDTAYTSVAGVTRYDTLADMAAAVTKVGSFNVTETGITWG